MKNLREMKSIKMVHITENGEVLTSYISFNQFEQSFVKERWEGERRTLTTYTMFGKYHTKTTVTNPYSGLKSIRTFEFPSSRDQALELDTMNCEVK